MKKYSILIGIAFVFFSCEDFLEKDPQGVLSLTTFYTNAEEATFAVNAAYDGIQNYWVYGAMSIVEDVQSDDALKGGGGASDQPGMDQMQNFIAATDNHIFSDKWRGYYSAIFRANLALEKVPEVPAENIDENLRARLIAEVKFIRALSYFDLVNRYGAVPLVRRASHPDDEKIAKSSVEEIWAAIEQDLTDALNNLTTPGELPASEVGRATKGAAHALLAKAYIYQEKWADANQALTSVINDYGYTLSDNFESIFGIGNEDNPEIIFQIGFQTGGASDAEGYNRNGWIAPRTSDVNWAGIGFLLPTQNLIDEFESGDIRLAASVLRDGDTFSGDTYKGAWSPTGYNCKKGLVAFTDYSAGTPFFVNNNYPVLRLGDMLLLKAEALNELGRTNEAETYINQVRSRAQLPTISGLSQQAMREAIYHERRVELCFEQQRYFDLVRWGIVDTKLKDMGNGFVKGKHETWAIPQSEIDINENLTQNPGWQ